MTIELTILISILGVVIALQSYQLNKKKHQSDQQNFEKREAESDVKESAEIRTQLVYIIKGVDDIRLDIRANERQMVALGERVTRVEESSKQAHKRLDSIKKESIKIEEY